MTSGKTFLKKCCLSRILNDERKLFMQNSCRRRGEKSLVCRKNKRCKNLELGRAPHLYYSVRRDPVQSVWTEESSVNLDWERYAELRDKIRIPNFTVKALETIVCLSRQMPS